MCSSGKGSTSTTTSQVQLPPQLQQAYTALMGLGSTIAQQPLSQYGGPLVAGFNPDQTSAFGLTESNAGAWAPFLNQASSLTNAGAASTFGQIPKYDASTLQQFYNPYQQDVIDSTMANIQKSDAIAQNQLRSQGLLSGASPFYGDRAGVTAAELGRNQALARDQTIAQLATQGFSGAQSALAGQQNLALQGLGADANRQITAGGQMSGLGQLLSSLSGQDVTRLLASGALQQQTAQEQLNVPYQQFQEQQQYPFKIAQFLQSLLTGQPSQATTTTAATTPGPNPISQIAGLGLALAGLPAGGGLLGSALGGIGSFLGGIFKRGGSVGYDAGGAPQIDPSAFQVSSRYTPGYVNAPQTAIYALPQINPSTIPPPRVYQLPPAVRSALAKFPGFIPTPGGIGGATGSSNQNFLDFINSTFGTSFSRGGYASGGNDPYLMSGVPQATTFGDASLTLPQPPAPVAPAPAAPVGPTAPTAAKSPTVKSLGASLKDSGVNPLLNIGLSIMANQSPFPGVAIGQGALAGIQASEEQKNSLDAGAQVLTDAPTYRILYADGHVYDTGVPNLTPHVVPPTKIGTDFFGRDIYGVPDGKGGWTPVNPSSGGLLGLGSSGEAGSQVAADGQPTGTDLPPGKTASGAPVPASGITEQQGQAIVAQLGSVAPTAPGETIELAQAGRGSVQAPTYDSLPKTLQNYVDAMVEGRVAAPSSYQLAKQPIWLTLQEAADERDKALGGSGFDFGVARQRANTRNNFAQGQYSKYIANGNTGIEHLGNAFDQIDKLPTSETGGLPFVQYWANQLRQAGAKGTGTPEAQALTKYSSEIGLAAEELTQFYRGTGGAEADINRLLGNLDAAKSKQELKAGFQALVDLVNSKVDVLQNTWHNGMGDYVPDYPIINKQSNAAISRITSGAQSPEQQGTQQSIQEFLKEQGIVQ